MNFDWKFVEFATVANLLLAGWWKIARMFKDWLSSVVDARLAGHLNKLATKEEVIEIRHELHNLIDKHIH